MSSRHTQRGLTLIELVVFIVIVGIAASTILSVMGNLARQSAALLPERQAQTIASAMLDEIIAQPDTYCDPDDPAAATANNVAACNVAEVSGPEPGETRGGASPFDNVNDYAGYGPAAVSFPDNSAVGNLTGYTAQVSVQTAGAITGVPPHETRYITVTVTPPGGLPVRLQAVRIRYTPNT